MMPSAASMALALGGAALASGVLTGVVRATIARSMLDHPNERSSHSVVVPRGGGVSIVVVVLATVAWCLATGRVAPRLAYAILGGGASIALIGWLDDRASLSAGVRLIVQLVAGAWTVAWLGGFPTLAVGTGHLTLGLFGSVLAVLAIVWSTNLFNFMDGIDGIAGVEGLVVGVAAAMLLVGGRGNGIGVISLAAAGACAGFLCWNWQPARIFMGDVGSAFLGYLFATLGVATERTDTLPALVWVLLAAVFIVDSTVTLVRRVPRGYWKEAHRTHAYQRAVQMGWSHARVSATVGALGLVLAMLGAAAVRSPARLLPLLAGGCALAGVAYVLVGRRQPFPHLPPKPNAGRAQASRAE